MYTMMMMMHWLLWIRGRVVVSVLPAGVAMYFYRTTFWFYRERICVYSRFLVHYFYGR